jgi:hypothetical protein
VNIIPIRRLRRRDDGLYIVPTNRPDRCGLIDAIDRDAVAKYNWHAYTCGAGHRTYYLARSLPRRGAKVQKVLALHRFIARRMGIGRLIQIDHRNRRGWDCRRRNLRPGAALLNAWNTPLRADNTSGVKGVHWCKANRRWYASIRVNKVKLHLGCFKAKSAARAARLRASKAYHGKFAGQETRRSR